MLESHFVTPAMFIKKAHSVLRLDPDYETLTEGYLRAKGNVEALPNRPF